MTDIAERPVASVWPRFFAALRRPTVTHNGLWIGWMLPAPVVLAWQSCSSLGWISDTVMPSPTAVGAAAWRLMLSGELPQNLGVSALRALAGLVVGGGVGLALGLLNGLSRVSFSVTDTSLQMIRNVPHLALIPLVIVWFGIDEGAKLFIVALGVFFPIYLNTLHGVRSVDPQLIEMAGSYGFRGWSLFRRVIWPGALPDFRWPSLRARRDVADADLRGDDRRAVRDRLHGHAGTRVHADRCYSTLDLALCASGQRRRLVGEGSRALATGLAPRFARTAVTPMSVAIEHDTHLGRPAAGAPLTLRGVRKAFGAKTVLNGVDLHVPGGQFLTIVGRSGCGKSTLLRLVAGLDEPSAGRIEVEGTPEGRARLARIMFQEPRLLPWARVDANVAIGLGPAADHTKALHRSREALATVGLVDRAGEWPSTLSGGQKQRVALARALVSAPRVLALDEPLGALDALKRIEMQRLVEQVWLSNSFTAILVTHDVTEAVALGDRIVLIDQGAIAADIPVDLARPR